MICNNYVIFSLLFALLKIKTVFASESVNISNSLLEEPYNIVTKITDTTSIRDCVSVPFCADFTVLDSTFQDLKKHELVNHAIPSEIVRLIWRYSYYSLIYALHEKSMENEEASIVSAIDPDTKNTIADIKTGKSSKFITLVEKNIYVLNQDSNDVSVIDTTTNTKIMDIPVQGKHPTFATTVEKDLYVFNLYSSSVSIIDTVTNQQKVPDILVGEWPIAATLLGNSLYAFNHQSCFFSIIDTKSLTRTTTVPFRKLVRFVTCVGTNIYALCEQSDDVLVFDTVTKAQTANIRVGQTPCFAVAAAKDLYVLNQSANTVSVINTENNIKIKDIIVEQMPTFATLIGSYLYVLNKMPRQSMTNNVSVIDTISKNKVADISVNGFFPSKATIIDDNLAVHCSNGLYMIHLDKITPDNVPAE